MSKQRWGYCVLDKGTSSARSAGVMDLATFLGDPTAAHVQQGYDWKAAGCLSAAACPTPAPVGTPRPQKMYCCTDGVRIWCDTAATTRSCYETPAYGDCNTCNPFNYFYWYMDENCQWTSGAGRPICGFGGISWSPISLIWDAAASLTTDMTVVSFSINASQPEAYSLWKASGKTPLLVYDPKHTGKVTSARQLFGAYAFGGQTSRVADYESEAVRTPWSSGYAAMELLDDNHDGKLAGNELRALALWFDHNRDGISQRGEVKSLSSVGVKALYFKPNRTDPETGDIRTEVGYERLVDGKLVKGASVDWFAKTFSTRQEATVALSSMFQRESEADAAAALAALGAGPDGVQNWPHNPLRFKPHEAKNHLTDLSGYWYWTVNEKGGRNVPGIFAFEQSGARDLVGYSVVEARLEKNPDHLASVVSLMPAKGTVSHDPDGNVQLTMEIVDKKTGGIATSTAVLSEDGMVLLGKTTQKLVVENNSATVNYEWAARKFITPEESARIVSPRAGESRK